MPLNYCTEVPDAAAYKALYDTTAWSPVERPADFYAAALAGSWRFCAAYDDGVLVGVGRVISDGHLHGFITEMIVHPGHQQRGIGARILADLVAACHAAGVTDIQIFCAQGKEAFYRKGGFLPRPATRPGMQYTSGRDL